MEQVVACCWAEQLLLLLILRCMESRYSFYRVLRYQKQQRFELLLQIQCDQLVVRVLMVLVVDFYWCKLLLLLQTIL